MAALFRPDARPRAMPPDIIYLAWGRPQRPRANLIQTMHTVEALNAAGAATVLYLPRLPRGFDVAGFLAKMGVHQSIDLRARESLHRRWGGWPFALAHRSEMRSAGAVFTRVPELSLVLARLGIPHWLEIHDTEPLARSGRLARILANSRNGGTIRGFVTVSEAGRQSLITHGALPHQVHTISNGVDLEAFAAVPAPTVQELAAPRSVYVGRVSRDRGLTLFETIAAAGHPVTVVGPCEDAPASTHPLLDLRPAVPHANVPACLAEGVIALMPYQADLRHAASISPIKLFEAMAAGRVVLASDLPALREIIRSGENGVLLPPDDPQAWIRALHHLQTHPDAALTMAARARQDARGYSWSRRAEHLVNILATKAP